MKQIKDKLISNPILSPFREIVNWDALERFDNLRLEEVWFQIHKCHSVYLEQAKKLDEMFQRKIKEYQSNS